MSAPGQDPIDKLAFLILLDAQKKGAREIELQAHEKGLRFSYRIDGTLKQVMEPPLGLREALPGRFKELAGLEDGDSARPREGRFAIRLGTPGEELEYAVSVDLTDAGERLMLRQVPRS